MSCMAGPSTSTSTSRGPAPPQTERELFASWVKYLEADVGIKGTSAEKVANWFTKEEYVPEDIDDIPLNDVENGLSTASGVKGGHALRLMTYLRKRRDNAKKAPSPQESATTNIYHGPFQCGGWKGP